MRSSVIKIKNFENNYILGIIGVKSQISYFYLMRLIFNSKDIANINPIEKTERTISSPARTVSCFETEKNYIMCFYQNISLEYVIGVYDNNLNNKTFLTIEEDGSSNIDIFFRAIHFTGEVGAFLYYFYNGEESHIYIQFKQYDNITNTISDYFVSNPLIKIDKGGNLANTTLYNDIIKISDSKFCISVYYGDIKKIYIILVNNYVDEKIKIRYFYINLYNLYYYRFSVELEMSLYNNFISIVTNFKNDYESGNIKGFLIN